MRTGLRVNFVKVHKVNNIIIDCAARNAEPFRKIIDAIFFICILKLNNFIAAYFDVRHSITSSHFSKPHLKCN